MKNIEELIEIWLFCQTDLEIPIRWSKYVKWEKNGKPARYNGIRRQNVLQHSFSKLFGYSMLLPDLKKVFGKSADFDLLFSCIVKHDFGEAVSGKKYDILAHKKVGNDDLEEYHLVMRFLKDTSLKNKTMINHFEKSFLLQFALTSYDIFPEDAKLIMARIRKNKRERNAAILFQILEKWEYHFYAYEHRKKHPTIVQDVSDRNRPIIQSWIKMLPKRHHQKLKEIFLD